MFVNKINRKRRGAARKDTQSPAHQRFLSGNVSPEGLCAQSFCRILWARKEMTPGLQVGTACAHRSQVSPGNEAAPNWASRRLCFL